MSAQIHNYIPFILALSYSWDNSVYCIDVTLVAVVSLEGSVTSSGETSINMVTEVVWPATGDTAVNPTPYSFHQHGDTGFLAGHR